VQPSGLEYRDLGDDRNAITDHDIRCGLYQRHGARLSHPATSSIGQQFSCQSSQRMRCNQGDHTVATETKPVHPVGQPISASTNSGFKVRRVSEVSVPATFITRTWRPSRPLTGVFANVVAPSLWSRAVGVIHIRLAWVRSAVRRLPALGLQPSFAIGVGQSRAIRSRPFSSRLSPPRLRKLSVCGVGHSAAVVARFIPCLPASCEGVGFVCRFSFALALGVGHSRNISVRFPPLDRIPEQARGVGQLVAFADGEDEQPLAPVGRTDFRRRKEACRKAVAHADQSAGDFGEAEAEMMGDILKEDEGRLDLSDDAGDMGPEVAWVICAKPFACDRKWLAWIPCTEDIHSAAPRSAVEGSNVVPDNSLIQGRVFHPRHESGCGKGFPLDMAHSTISGDGDGEPEVESARARAEGEAKQACVFSSGSASGGR